MSRTRVFATTTVLNVADVPRALAFYAKLGFADPATYGEDNFGMANRDGFDIMLQRGTPSPNNTAWDMHVRVEDLAAEERALRAEGVTITRGPESTEYGMIELEVRDPDGHRVCFGQDLERRPEDAGR
jgi:catechol 2,3-dioxygenase-like lactoylglutathione lyase family enzyme